MLYSYSLYLQVLLTIDLIVKKLSLIWFFRHKPNHTFICSLLHPDYTRTLLEALERYLKNSFLNIKPHF